MPLPPCVPRGNRAPPPVAAAIARTEDVVESKEWARASLTGRDGSVLSLVLVAAAPRVAAVVLLRFADAAEEPETPRRNSTSVLLPEALPPPIEVEAEFKSAVAGETLLRLRRTTVLAGGASPCFNSGVINGGRQRDVCLPGVSDRLTVNVAIDAREDRIKVVFEVEFVGVAPEA